jgi:lipoate-protein ligase A
VWRDSRPRGQHEAVFKELHLIPPGESYDGPMQMALDEVLLGSVNVPTLRIYRWMGPCVTFGYFQKIAEVRTTFPDLPLVRRWTGGGMVEHGGDLTFSLMIPRGDSAALMSPAIFYRELHGRIARWLSDVLSPEIRLAREGDLRAGGACFMAPVSDDLLLEGRKILGGAQRRSAGALLYQGSIQGVDSMSWDPHGLARDLCSQYRETSLPGELSEKAHRLAGERYGSVAWNEKR